jgi:adenylate kinase family enzyme
VKCKNLIIIIGTSCQGKSYIAKQLRDKYGFYIIHTDQFYHPLDREPVKCVVGEENEEKNDFIKKQIPNITETTIIEGSHIGNQRELDIFVRELGFDGNIYKFEVRSDKLKEQFASKYKENVEEKFIEIESWFNKIYDLKDVVIVKSADGIVNFLKIKDGHICISR